MLARPPAAGLLRGPMRAALRDSAECGGRFFRLREGRAASSNLRCTWQVCHSLRPQAGVHRRHSVETGLGSRSGKPRHELEQRPVRDAKDSRECHKNSGPPLSQHSCRTGDGRSRDGPLTLGSTI